MATSRNSMTGNRGNIAASAKAALPKAPTLLPAHSAFRGVNHIILDKASFRSPTQVLLTQQAYSSFISWLGLGSHAILGNAHFTITDPATSSFVQQDES